jgi:Flp pilus assembly protein TadB
MSRHRRPRRNRSDSIRNLENWQNHQYDPGYLSNLGRLRLFSGGYRTPARYLLTSLGAVLALVMVVFVLVSVGLAFPIAALIVGGALFAVLTMTRGRHSKRQGVRRRQ